MDAVAALKHRFPAHNCRLVTGPQVSTIRSRQSLPIEFVVVGSPLEKENTDTLRWLPNFATLKRLTAYPEEQVPNLSTRYSGETTDVASYSANRTSGNTVRANQCISVRFSQEDLIP